MYSSFIISYIAIKAYVVYSSSLQISINSLTCVKYSDLKHNLEKESKDKEQFVPGLLMLNPLVMMLCLVVVLQRDERDGWEREGQLEHRYTTGTDHKSENLYCSKRQNQKNVLESTWWTRFYRK